MTLNDLNTRIIRICVHFNNSGSCKILKKGARMRFIATCKLGLESVVAMELRTLDIVVDEVLDARVIFFRR
jgi:hypothetical protein